MIDYIYFDCPGCGEIGLESELQEHNTRPMPQDIGFCPKCGWEIDELQPESTIRLTLESYGEDADAALAEIRERVDK